MVAPRDQLHHVFWIGGGSGAGKSTVARRIAARHGLRVYSTDDAMGDHAARSTEKECPLLHAFMAMEMDERWVTRSPETMLETFHWFRGEGFDLIIEDLLRLSSDQGVIVEGFRLLPALVAPLLSVPDHAVWLLPTPEFRRHAIEERGGSAAGFLGKTSDPERGLHNLLERDRMFTNRLREETGRLRLPTFDVDLTMSEAEVASAVSSLFRLSP